MSLADRVRQGRLVDPAKIGAAADRILRDFGVSRCFSTKITHGVFSWDYLEEAIHYEERLSGRYVITTSLDQNSASTAQVVGDYKALQSVERRFRVLKGNSWSCARSSTTPKTACGDTSPSTCSALSWKR